MKENNQKTKTKKRNKMFKKIALNLVSSFVLFFALTGSSFALTCYWASNASNSDFHDSLNWAGTSGGTSNTCGTNEAPDDSSDTAIFDDNSFDNTVNLTSSTNLTSLLTETGFAGTINLNNDLTLSNSFDVDAGTINIGAFTLDIDSYLRIGGADVDAGAAVAINVDQADNTDAIDLNSGSLIAPSSGTITLVGGWDQENGFNFDPNGGSVEFSGDIESRISTPTDTIETFNNVIFSKTLVASTENIQVNNEFNVDGLLTLTGGAITGNGIINANGTLDFNDTFGVNIDSSFIPQSGDLRISTTNDVDIESGAGCPNIIVDSLNHNDIADPDGMDVRIDVSGGTDGTQCESITIANTGSNIDPDFDVNDDDLTLDTFATALQIDAGSFDAGSGTLDFTGDIDLNGGTYVGASGSSQTMDQLRLDGGSFDASNMSSVTITSSDQTNALDINGGTLTAPAVLNIYGGMNISGSGSFVHNNGLVNFTSQYESRLGFSTTPDFYDVSITKTVAASTQDVSINSDFNVNNTLNLTSGDLTGSSDIFAKGSINWDSGFGKNLDNSYTTLSGNLTIQTTGDVLIPSGAGCPDIRVDTPGNTVSIDGNNPGGTICSSIVVDSGTFDTDTLGDGNTDGDDLSTRNFPNIIINGGTFYSGENTVIRLTPNDYISPTDYFGDLDINGGVFQGETGSEIYLDEMFVDNGDMNAGAMTSIDAYANDSVSTFDLNSGTFTAPATINLSGGWDQESGHTFSHNNGLLNFNQGSESRISISTASPPQEFYDVTIAKDLAASTQEVVANDDIEVTNLLTLITGDLTGADAIIATGSVDYQNTFGKNSDNSYTVLSGEVQFQTTGNVTIPAGVGCPNIVVNTPGNTVSIDGNTANGTICSSVTVNDGTFDTDTSGDGNSDGEDLSTRGIPNIQINGGTFYTGENTVIRLSPDNFSTPTDYFGDLDINGGLLQGESGSELYFDEMFIDTGSFDAGAMTSIDAYGSDSVSTFDLNSGTFTAPTTINISGGWDQSVSHTFNNNNGLINFNGIYQSRVTINNSDSLYDVSINKTGVNEASFQTDIYIDNNLNINDGELLMPNDTIFIEGNWTMDPNGTFTNGTSTVDFTKEGGNQIIYGSTNFNNLVKTVNQPSTLTFESAELQTIEGDMTLTGTSLGDLELRATTETVRALIDPQGARTISYLDVQDNENINVTEIATTGFNITDSYNNVGWEGLSSSQPATIPEFSFYMLMGVLLMGFYMTYHKTREVELKV